MQVERKSEEYRVDFGVLGEQKEEIRMSVDTTGRNGRGKDGWAAMVREKQVDCGKRQGLEQCDRCKSPLGSVSDKVIGTMYTRGKKNLFFPW